DLFVVPVDGSAAPLQLSGPDNRIIDYAHFTADGARIVYFHEPAAGANELYNVPVDGSASPVRLTHPMVAFGMIDLSPPFVLAGTRVLYRADASIDDVWELFTVPVDRSSPPVRLHAPLSGGRDVMDWRLSADASRVVFAADLAAEDQLELWSAPVDASASPQ